MTIRSPIAPETLAGLEAQIAEARQRLLLTLDAAGSTGAWEWDIPARTLRGDASFATLTGQDAVALDAGVPTSHFFLGIHPEDQKRIRLAVAAILAGAEVFEKDYRLRKADGGLRWVHAKGRALFNEDDEPIRFTGHLVDVTEQKRVQERFRIAQTAGGIGTFERGEGFGTLQVSQQFCHLLGLHPTKVLPLATVNRLIHPDDPPIAAATSGQLEAGGSHIEFRITRADNGEPRWLARRGEYVRDLSGPGMRYIGVAYDITASKLIEERLRRSNEGLSERVRERTQDLNRVWQNSRDLLAVLDLDGRIRDANPAWREALGYTVNDVIGRSLADFEWSDDVAAALPDLTRGTERFELQLRHAKGAAHSTVWTTSREGISIYAYGRDVTVEREQAKALKDAEARLRQSQKMEAVGQLTGGIAHDFNNMLTGIMGALDIVKRRIKAGRLDDIERFMDAATVSAQRAASLTHRLLAFSRRQSLDRRPVDVARLVRGMSELLIRTLGEQVTLVFDLDHAWPIVTDGNQLENALLNLAINGRDAMPAGGELRIAARNVTLHHNEVAGLTLTAPRDFVVIQVSDSGQGMPPDVLDKAFDPFFTTKPIGQGTGLGLSMVYGFAQQSGGATEISSSLGHGTTVSIYLPRGADEHGTGEGAASHDVPLGSGEHILVVEDDESVRLLVCEVLRDLGYAPLEAADANAAIEKLTANPDFDLLITDVGLPGMNGRQLADVARELTPSIGVLFMTGYAAGARDRTEFLGDNMDMISKPFDLEQLASKIREMLV
ncbi:PAS domain-containing protein [Aestuariivirga sp.]|uniref:PAS domain-containing protein n=1 Tax=Aestuariivirga sp. TaxID=2650926 RepID=UPI003BAC34D2